MKMALRQYCIEHGRDTLLREWDAARNGGLTPSDVSFGSHQKVYCDMIGAGIVDPAKVTRSALENAASVSSMVLTTEALVADKPEPPAPAAPAGMGGMDGMY